jgi:hypothetical protein
MTEPTTLSTNQSAGVERSTRDIRRDIAQEVANITQTIEQIGKRINRKLDWREYLNDYPYWALGAAAGLGYLASGIFRTGDTIGKGESGSNSETDHNSLGDLFAETVGSELVKATLLGIAAKAASSWLLHAASTDKQTAAKSPDRSHA